MVVRGRVQNGVIVLMDDIRLPEGDEVTVVSSAVQSDGHGVLDIPVVSLGPIVPGVGRDGDLLGEMLEGRS